MTHLIVLFHTLKHQENDSVTYSDVLEFENSFEAEDCSVCTIYLEVDLSEFQAKLYTFLVPKFISHQILQQEDQFKPVVLYFKQSRSPPYFTI